MYKPYEAKEKKKKKCFDIIRMNEYLSSLPSKFMEILDRNGISTSKEILCMSVADIKHKSTLTNNEIKKIKTTITEKLQPKSVTCDQLMLTENMIPRISTCCSSIDQVLCGGFRRGTITEIYGESGSGKTQIALQTSAFNWAEGSLFICTEDAFPIKRFQQIKKRMTNNVITTDTGKNTFVEYITESSDLLSCIRIRLPKLVETNNISIVIIDSVAAPFRIEHAGYMLRAEELRELAMSLVTIAQRYNIAILCTNQVAAAIDISSEDVLPSLGLAWSNMICTRLFLKKTNIEQSVCIGDEIKFERCCSKIRELSVKFSPELPHTVAKFIITPNGLQSV